MSQPPRDHIALIVEEDVGFLLWLGQLLMEAGYRTVPASNCRQAMVFVHELGLPIHLAVLNPKQRGATNLLRALETANRRLRIVVIGEGFSDVPARVPVSAILEKPRSWTAISRNDWLKRVQQALADAPQYTSSTISGRSA